MRLAVLSDIHGNLAALQAVLEDLQASGGADHLWILGDLAVFGLQPSECVQTVKALTEAKVIQGNTDRYLFTGVRSEMPVPTAENWAKMAARTRTRDAAFSWTLERLTWEDIEYLMKLPTDLALEVEDYGWVVGFHASPGDDEKQLLPAAADHEIHDALLDREGSMAFGGHTHVAMDRDLGTWRMINPGSVGMPLDGDPRAAYALVTFEHGLPEVELRRVEYDRAALIAQFEASDHPMKERAVKLLQTGKS